MLVDNPMIHSPFEEPTYYWDYREGQTVLAAGRRPARALLRQVLVIPPFGPRRSRPVADVDRSVRDEVRTMGASKRAGLGC